MMTFPRVCKYAACRRAFTVTARERRACVVYCSAKCGRNDRGLDAFGRPIIVAHLPHPAPRRTA